MRQDSGNPGKSERKVGNLESPAHSFRASTINFRAAGNESLRKMSIGTLAITSTSLPWSLARPARAAHAEKKYMNRAAEQRIHALVTKEGDFVMRSLRNMGVRDGEIDDCVQKVFLVAARRLDDIEPGKERSFLFGCARNTVNHLRRTMARRRETSDDSLVNQPDPDILPDRLVQQKRTRELLDDVLEAMTDGLREVFVLCVFEEMTMAEVASALELPPGTVASRLRRARQLFKEEVLRRKAAESQESA